MKGAALGKFPCARNGYYDSPKYLFSKGRRRDFARGQLHLFRIQGCQFCESCLHMIHSACSVRLRWDSRSQDGMNKIMLCNTGHCQLAAYRVLVLPADPPLLSGPAPPQETLTESEQRRTGQFPRARNYFCDRQTMHFRRIRGVTARPSICSRFDRVKTQHGSICFRVLILCCIVTPTDQLTHRLFDRLLH
jgi:hypothetical protein